MVLGVVLLAGFSLLFPTVRAYLGQRAELDALAADVAASEQRAENLRAELDRWDDPAYVAAQARQRLSYVMPGETSYRVIDPEIVQDEAPAEDPTGDATGPRVPTGADVAPWYTSVWESVRIAGETELSGGSEP
jgi:cell division protein FtsB